MTQNVTLPDGTVNSFPDDATPEMMSGALKDTPPAVPMSGTNGSYPSATTMGFSPDKPIPSDPVTDKAFEQTTAGKIYAGLRNISDTMAERAQESPLGLGTMQEIKDGNWLHEYDNANTSFYSAFVDGLLKPAAVSADLMLSMGNTAMAGAGAAVAQITGRESDAKDTEDFIQFLGIHSAMSPQGVPLVDSLPEKEALSKSAATETAETPKSAPTMAAANESPTLNVPIEKPMPLQDGSGNLNLDYVKTSADAKNLLAKTAQDYADKSGVTITHEESIANAQDFMDKATTDVASGIPEFLSDYNRGDPVNTAKSLAARQAVVDATTNYMKLAKSAVQTGTEDDMNAATEAWEKLEILQGTRHEMTAESGRVLESHKISVGDEGMEAVADKLTEANLPPDQLHKFAASLDTPQAAAKLLKDSRWENFAKMPLYYVVNNYLSGPLTHAAYMASWAVQSIIRAGIETPIASLVGKIQDSFGRTLEPGEVVKLQTEADAISDRLAESTSEQGSPLAAHDSVVMEKRLAAIKQQLGDAITVMPKEAAARLYGLGEGTLDAIKAFGRAIKSGRIEVLPGEKGWNPTDDIGQNPIVDWGRSFDNPILSNIIKGAGHVVGVPTRVIGAIHSMQKIWAYTESLNALAYRQAASEGLEGSMFDRETEMGARIAQLKNDPSPEMMQASVNEAKYAALMGEPGKLGRNIERLANTNGYTKIIVPFARVMNNLNGQFFLERTPMGLFSDKVRGDLFGANGNAAQATAVGKMATGVITLTGAAYMCSQGLTHGQAPDNKNEKSFDYLSGRPPYSVVIGDTAWPMRFFGLPGRSLAVGADLHDIFLAGKLAEQEGDSGTNAVLAMAGHTFGNNLMDESGMRGVSELYQAMKDQNYAKYYWPNTIAAMAVPMSVGQGQVTRMIDPILRETAAPDFYERLKETMMAKSPLFSSSLTPRVDIFGNPLQRSMDHSWADNDPVMQNLQRLEVFPTTVTNRLFNQRLTEEQSFDYATKAGKLFYTSLNQQMKDPHWMALSDEAQMDIIDKTVKDTRKQAKQYMACAYPQLTIDSAKQYQDLCKQP